MSFTVDELKLNSQASSLALIENSASGGESAGNVSESCWLFTSPASPEALMNKIVNVRNEFLLAKMRVF